jgi:hypothetical protein
MEIPTRKEKTKLTALELASVVASWSTALALILGFVTFILTYRAQERFNQAQIKFNEDQRRFNIAQKEATDKQAEFQAETAAIDALRAYFAAGIEAAPSSGKTDWLTNDALFTAETLYNLRSSDPGWRETAKGLILNRRKLIDNGYFDCEKYGPDFVKWVQNIVQRDPCQRARR